MMLGLKNHEIGNKRGEILFSNRQPRILIRFLNIPLPQRSLDCACAKIVNHGPKDYDQYLNSPAICS